MPLETLMQRIVEQMENFEHRFDVVEMESEGVFSSWIVEISTVNTIPQSNISIDLGRTELRQSAHAGHSFASSESVDQIFSQVGFDGF